MLDRGRRGRRAGSGVLQRYLQGRLRQPKRFFSLAVEDVRGQRTGRGIEHELDVGELRTQLDQRAAVRRVVFVSARRRRRWRLASGAGGAARRAPKKDRGTRAQRNDFQKRLFKRWA